MKIGIVGLGVAGLMAAWKLTQAGHEVFGFDQYSAGHNLGSSHGESRIVRRVYPDPYYTRLMNDSYALWDEFTHAANDATLLTKCGGLFIGGKDHPDMQLAISSMQEAGAMHEILDASATMQRFPAFRIAEHEVAIYDAEMGYARASAVVAAALRLAVSSGASLQFGVTATVIPGEKPAVNVGGGLTLFDAVLVAAGSWTNAALDPLGIQLPLNVTRQVYINLTTETQDDLLCSYPVWIDAESLYYGFPELGHTAGTKIARHVSGNPTHPESIERILSDADRAPLLDYALKRFANVSPPIVDEGTCLYTNTPDEDFVIDFVPGDRNVVVVTACSGHGFKFGPLVGEIAARLATGEKVAQDISRFRYDRF